MNKHLLLNSEFIQFRLGDQILITGNSDKNLISFDPDSLEAVSSGIELAKVDSFRYLDDGVNMGNEMYLVGYYHIQVIDLETNKVSLIDKKGFVYAK